jgi:hypothetical protein
MEVMSITEMLELVPLLKVHRQHMVLIFKNLWLSNRSINSQITQNFNTC